MNSEIVSLLEEAYPPPDPLSDAAFEAWIDYIREADDLDERRQRRRDFMGALGKVPFQGGLDFPSQQEAPPQALARLRAMADKAQRSRQSDPAEPEPAPASKRRLNIRSQKKR